MSHHKANLDLAMAAMLEIISSAQAMQAAVLRGASGEEIFDMRDKTHDQLDAYLDHMTNAAMNVQFIRTRAE